MRTMEAIVHEFLQLDAEAMLHNQPLSEDVRDRMTALLNELEPHILLQSDTNPQDAPPFDYRLLASIHPKMLMMILLQSVFDTAEAIRECA